MDSRCPSSHVTFEEIPYNCQSDPNYTSKYDNCDLFDPPIQMKPRPAEAVAVGQSVGAIVASSMAKSVSTTLVGDEQKSSPPAGPSAGPGEKKVDFPANVEEAEVEEKKKEPEEKKEVVEGSSDASVKVSTTLVGDEQKSSPPAGPSAGPGKEKVDFPPKEKEAEVEEKEKEPEEKKEVVEGSSDASVKVPKETTSETNDAPTVEVVTEKPTNSQVEEPVFGGNPVFVSPLTKESLKKSNDAHARLSNTDKVKMVERMIGVAVPGEYDDVRVPVIGPSENDPPILATPPSRSSGRRIKIVHGVKQPKPVVEGPESQDTEVSLKDTESSQQDTQTVGRQHTLENDDKEDSDMTPSKKLSETKKNSLDTEIKNKSSPKAGSEVVTVENHQTTQPECSGEPLKVVWAGTPTSPWDSETRCNDQIYLENRLNAPSPKKQQSARIRRIMKRGNGANKGTWEEEIKFHLGNDCDEGIILMDAGEMGAGVQTARPFLRNDFIAEYTGELVDSSKAIKKRRKKYNCNVNKTGKIPSYEFEFYFKGKKYWIDSDRDTGRLGRLINHDSGPNVNVKPMVFEVAGKPRLLFVAKRDIEKGEQLFYTYGETDPAILKANPWLKPRYVHGKPGIASKPTRLTFGNDRSETGTAGPESIAVRPVFVNPPAAEVNDDINDAAAAPTTVSADGTKTTVATQTDCEMVFLRKHEYEALTAFGSHLRSQHHQPLKDEEEVALTRDKLEKNKKRRNTGDEGGEEKKSFPGNGRAKKPKTTESEEISGEGEDEVAQLDSSIEIKPKKIQRRHGARKSNIGIRSVQSAQYLEDLDPIQDEYPTPGNWKPTMEHGKKYYRFLCRDYEIAAGEISVPEDAKVTWGFDKPRLKAAEYAGDICPGVTLVTPPAQDKLSQYKIGCQVNYTVSASPGSKVGRKDRMVSGTHWGDGILLRDEERVVLQDQLRRDVFGTEEKELTPGLVAHLLRAFWPGRTYVRLFKFCGRKGKKLSEFHLARMAAVFRFIECEFEAWQRERKLKNPSPYSLETIERKLKNRVRHYVESRQKILRTNLAIPPEWFTGWFGKRNPKTKDWGFPTAARRAIFQEVQQEMGLDTSSTSSLDASEDHSDGSDEEEETLKQVVKNRRGPKDTNLQVRKSAKKKKPSDGSDKEEETKKFKQVLKNGRGRGPKGSNVQVGKSAKEIKNGESNQSVISPVPRTRNRKRRFSPAPESDPNGGPSLPTEIKRRKKKCPGGSNSNKNEERSIATLVIHTERLRRGIKGKGDLKKAASNANVCKTPPKVCRRSGRKQENVNLPEEAGPSGLKRGQKKIKGTNLQSNAGGNQTVPSPEENGQGSTSILQQQRGAEVNIPDHQLQLIIKSIVAQMSKPK